MWPFSRKKSTSGDDSDQGRFMQVLTVLSPEDQKAIGGIPTEAIAGLSAPLLRIQTRWPRVKDSQ